MHSYHCASALTLIAFAASTLGQDCPTGYGRSIKWIDCPVAATETDDGNPTLQCGTLDVPLDYQNLSAGTLTLPLVKQPAVVSSNVTILNQSVIYNPDGPGASAINQIASGAGPALQSLFGQGYDIIGFDPRGVGLTHLLIDSDYDCPLTNDTYDGPHITPEDFQLAVDGFTSQGGLCASPDYHLYSELIGTAYVARDIVAIAQALGQDGLIRYYGASYGTLIGATLTAMFPERVDRVVLDGNINPTDYYFGLGDEAIASVDAAVANFFEECVAIGNSGPDACALAVPGKSAQDLQDQWDQFLDHMLATDPTAWSEAKDTMVGLLGRPSSWTELSQAIAELYNITGISKRQAAAPFDPLSGPVQTEGLIVQAVSCGDYLGTINATVANFQDWLKVYQSRSTYDGDGGLLNLIYQCSAWQVKAKERFEGPYTGVITRKPILFVNGMFDPVTPLVSAQNSSSGFVGSGVLVSRGAGHCSSAQKSSTLRAAIRQYFATGQIPDTTKVYKPDDLAFKAHKPEYGDVETDFYDDSTIDGIALRRKRDLSFFPTELLAGRDITGLSRIASRASTQDIPPGCAAVTTSSVTTPQPYTGNAQGGNTSLWGLVLAIVACIIAL